jgi:hypothetical protein
VFETLKDTFYFVQSYDMNRKFVKMEVEDFEKLLVVNSFGVVGV